MMGIPDGRKRFSRFDTILAVTDRHPPSQPAAEPRRRNTALTTSRGETRNSAIADKPVRRVYRSVKVTKHSTIPYVRYSFLLCSSNFVFKTRRFYRIRLQKCHDLENRVRDPSRSLEMSPCGRAHTTSYSRSIVTMALFRIVSDIFNVEKCLDLEIGVRGHSRSSKIIPCNPAPMTSY